MLRVLRAQSRQSSLLSNKFTDNLVQSEKKSAMQKLPKNKLKIITQSHQKLIKTMLIPAFSMHLSIGRILSSKIKKSKLVP
jgi:fructose-1,6-bisphosphatase